MREEHRSKPGIQPKSSNGSWGDGLMTGIVLGLVFSMLVWLMAYNTGINDMRDTAVAEDVACYYLDDKHKVKFAWEKNCPRVDTKRK